MGVVGVEPRIMRPILFIALKGVLAAAMVLALAARPGAAQSHAGTAQARAHVYLLRGLMNIFSLGMDSLAEELSKRGLYATVSNHRVAVARRSGGLKLQGRQGRSDRPHRSFPGC